MARAQWGEGPGAEEPPVERREREREERAAGRGERAKKGGPTDSPIDSGKIDGREILLEGFGFGIESNRSD